MLGNRKRIEFVASLVLFASACGHRKKKLFFLAISDNRHSVKLNLNRGKTARCRDDFNGVPRAGSGDSARLWASALAADAWVAQGPG